MSSAFVQDGLDIGGPPCLALLTLKLYAESENSTTASSRDQAGHLPFWETGKLAHNSAVKLKGLAKP